MIFRREWKRNVKSLIIWTTVMAVLILLMLSMYPQFAADQQAIQDMLKAYPEPLKKAFGMDTLNFGTLIGFYAVEAYMIMTLVGSVYAALLASGILVKEESEKTIEFLLSKPVTRTAIVGQKLLAVIVNLMVFNIGMAAASWIGFHFADDQVDLGSFVLLMISAFLLHTTFAALAFLLSAVMRKSRSIVSLALGIVFASYAIHITAGITDDASFLKHVSLFHYVDAADLLNKGELDGLYVTIMICIMVVSIGLAWKYYIRKDISV